MKQWWLTVLMVMVMAGSALAQDDAAVPDDDDDAAEVTAPQQPVQIDEIAPDERIARRLQRIIDSTTWFDGPEVRVDNGVVFLTGGTDKPKYREWATALAQRTEDVVAVVNRIEVEEGPLWDFSPAYATLRGLWRDFVQAIPLIVSSLLVLVVTVLIARLLIPLAEGLWGRRYSSPLLRSVMAKVTIVPLILLGIYIALRISGLTSLAVTVLGGTGLLGLIIGIAFRDIAENFLASMLISTQQPFARGDTITVDGHTGIVQKVTTRGTLLMALDGTYIQIPNSTIYKNVIENVTANPKSRADFTIGVGYDDAVTEAQEIAMTVMREHTAVLDDPEPMVLIDVLGASTVNLTVYFWVNTEQYNILRVKSAVMRLVKRAFVEHGISLPDEAREVIFPNDVPVRMITAEAGAPTPPVTDDPVCEPAEESAAGEGDLRADEDELEKQAAESRTPEQGEDLLSG